MKNFDLLKALILVVFVWIAFSLHKIANLQSETKVGKFTLYDNLILDTRTGVLYGFGTLNEKKVARIFQVTEPIEQYLDSIEHIED